VSESPIWTTQYPVSKKRMEKIFGNCTSDKGLILEVIRSADIIAHFKMDSTPK
jgi:hypothetical protein